MVVKKSGIISTALLLSLFAASSAYGENNLVQLDLKRSSASSVDVTLVTSDSYKDNVLVRKKSDNKYVILIPKVQSSGYSASNLNGLKDLVSDVDVKTVNDTSGGYTKVTLITTKPLDIKTQTVKSAPVTAEQKEYNTLIAQANAVKNTISTQTPKIKEQKTEVTIGKAPVQETKKPEVKKSETKKPDIKLAEITPENIEKQNKRNSNILNNVKKDKALEEVPTSAPALPAPVVDEEIQDIQDIVPSNNTVEQNKKLIFASIFNKIPRKLPKALGVVLLAIAAIALISNKSKRNVYDNTYSENIPEPLNTAETKDYDNIINSGLSWREKYQLYIDKSAEPISRGENKGKYSFIKKPSQKAIDAKRQELEKLVEEPANKEDLYEIVEDNNLYSEDSSISKTIKLKAFENTTNPLAMSRRKHRSRFKKYENEIPLREQKTVNLENSLLGSNPRSFKDANLEVSDVSKKRIKYKHSDYIMSSVDEYFDILDRENMPKSVKTTSNPIEKVKENSFFKGSIVKSGYKIDKDKGFYLVNKNGKNSLVGKVNDKVFVIKDFENNISNPIQVRHDNANVYMVKADNFKSLVEVNEDKMGVLIEL